MINRKFLYFKTLAGFKAAYIDLGTDGTGIRLDSIVFIGQERLIWNRGIFYGNELKDGKGKGLFLSEEQLLQAVPSPSKGDWALVKSGEKYYIYVCNIDGVWANSGDEYGMGMSKDEIELMFRWYTQDQEDLINGLQTNLSRIDSKYGDEVNRIDLILSNIPKTIITPDNIEDYLPEQTTIPEGVITVDNISQYLPEPQLIPEGIITEDNIDNYINTVDVDSQLSSLSENPVLNKVVYAALQNKADKSQLRDYATLELLLTYQLILQGKASNEDFLGWLLYINGISNSLDDKADLDYSESTYAKKDEISQEVNTYVTLILLTTEHSKGYFSNENELNIAVPEPEVGDWAIVSVDGVWMVYKCNTSGEWESTGQEFEFDIDLNEYAKKSDLSTLATKDQIALLLTQLSDKEDKSTSQAHMEYAETTYAKKGDVIQQITQIILTKEHSKGYFDSELDLIQEVPNPESGDWAIVAVDNKWIVYRCNNEGVWTSTGLEFKFDIDLTQYAKKEALNDLVTISSFADYKVDVAGDISDINDDILAIQAVLAGLDTTSSLQEHERYAENTYAKKGDVQQLVNLYVTQIVKTAEKAKGYFDTEQELNITIANPEVGDWAIVNVNGQWIIYRCATAGTWTSTGQLYSPDAPDLSLYAKTSDLETLATKAELTSHINQAEGKYLTEEDLSNYAKKTDIPLNIGSVTLNDLKLYVTKAELTSHSDYAEITYAKNSALTDVVRTGDILDVVRESDLDSFATKVYVDNAATNLDNKIKAISKVGSTSQDLTEFLTDLLNRIQYLYDKYVSWYLGNEEEPGSSDTPDTPDDPDTPVVYNNNMVTLTEAAYQALVEANEVDPDTYYFTYIEEEQPTPTSDTWQFGGLFPITFTDKWEFGDEFPIIFTDKWAFGGTFPIKLL